MALPTSSSRRSARERQSCNCSAEIIVYPRPVNGILVAITVMNKTLASRGKPAMYRTASATYLTSNVGSGFNEKSACKVPVENEAASEVTTKPKTNNPQTKTYWRPSSEVVFVRPD